MSNLGSIIGSVNSAPSVGGASQTLSADMNTFLKLLTAQLQYQDPLDPMDTAEYTNQLVQYSNVEQSIQTNDKLNNLLNLSIYNLGVQAANYVGKTVQVLGDVMPVDGGVGKATYTLNKNVQACTISVKDSSGKVVYTTTGENSSGAHDFVWDGKNQAGEQLPDGAYQIVVNTEAASGEQKATVTTTVFGRVTGVASDESGIYLGLGDAVTSTLDQVLTARDDKYWDNLISGLQKPDNSNPDSVAPEGSNDKLTPVA